MYLFMYVCIYVCMYVLTSFRGYQVRGYKISQSTIIEIFLNLENNIREQH